MQSFEGFNFFDSILQFSPTFLYHLNLFDKDVVGMNSRVKSLCNKFSEYEEAYKKKQQLQNEFISEINEFFHASKYIGEKEFSGLSNTVSLLFGHMNHYETMLMDQIGDLFNDMTNLFKSKNGHLLITRNSLKECQTNLDTCWSSLSRMQNISNVKDRDSYSVKCINFFAAKRNYQQHLATYVTVLYDIHRNVRLSVFKTFGGYLLSVFGYYINCSKTFSDSKNHIDLMYDLISCKEAINKQENLIIVEKYNNIKPIIYEQYTINVRELMIHGGDSLNPTKMTKNTAFSRIGNFLSNSAKDILNMNKKLEVSTSTMPRATSRSNLKLDASGDEANQLVNPILSDTYSVNVEQDDKTGTSDDVLSSGGNSFEIYKKKDKFLLIKPKGIINSPHYSYIDSCSLVANAMNTSQKNSPIGIEHFLEGASKYGYLLLKDKELHKTKFRRIFIMLRNDLGLIYSQGYDDRYPSIFAQLLLCSVKHCRPSEIDRSFCFKLTLPQTEYILQSTSDNEVAVWISALNDGITKALERAKRPFSQSDHDSNMDDSSAQNRAILALDRLKKDITGLRLTKIPGNGICADCKAPNPDWASINIGVLICIKCSGVHRSLGVSVSKVRSLTLDNWDEATLEEVMSKGNDTVNAIFEAKLQPGQMIKKNANYDVLTEYIKAKYIDKRFV